MLAGCWSDLLVIRSCMRATPRRLGSAFGRGHCRSLSESAAHFTILDWLASGGQKKQDRKANTHPQNGNKSSNCFHCVFGFFAVSLFLSIVCLVERLTIPLPFTQHQVVLLIVPESNFNLLSIRQAVNNNSPRWCRDVPPLGPN